MKESSDIVARVDGEESFSQAIHMLSVSISSSPLTLPVRGIHMAINLPSCRDDKTKRVPVPINTTNRVQKMFDNIGVNY